MDTGLNNQTTATATPPVSSKETTADAPASSEKPILPRDASDFPVVPASLISGTLAPDLATTGPTDAFTDLSQGRRSSLVASLRSLKGSNALHSDLELDDMSIDDMKIGGLTELDLSGWDDYETTITVAPGAEKPLGSSGESSMEGGLNDDVAFAAGRFGTGMPDFDDLDEQRLSVNEPMDTYEPNEAQDEDMGLTGAGTAYPTLDATKASTKISTAAPQSSVEAPNKTSPERRATASAASETSTPPPKTPKKPQSRRRSEASLLEDSMQSRYRKQIDDGADLPIAKRTRRNRRGAAGEDDGMGSGSASPISNGVYNESKSLNASAGILAAAIEASAGPPNLDKARLGEREEGGGTAVSTPATNGSRGSVGSEQSRKEVGTPTSLVEGRRGRIGSKSAGTGSEKKRKRKTLLVNQNEEENDDDDDASLPSSPVPSRHSRTASPLSPFEEEEIATPRLAGGVDHLADSSTQSSSIDLPPPPSLPLSLAPKDREETPSESLPTDGPSPPLAAASTLLATTKPITRSALLKDASLAATVAAAAAASAIAVGRRRGPGQRSKDKAEIGLAAAFAKSAFFRPYNPSKMAAVIPPLMVASPKEFSESVKSDPGGSLPGTLPRLFVEPPEPFVRVFGDSVTALSVGEHTVGPLPDEAVEAVGVKEEPWLPGEIEALDRGLEACGRNFTLLSRDYVPTRTTAECVSAYYRRKHSLRYTKVKLYKKRVQRDEEEYVRYVNGVAKFIVSESKRLKAEKPRNVAPSLLGDRQPVFGGGIFTSEEGSKGVDPRFEQFRRLSARVGMGGEMILSCFGKDSVPPPENLPPVRSARTRGPRVNDDFVRF
ncbi:hypothetical protein HDU67_009951 [Dinochytrium kinnereticum]|nr:hypothetical protein HDU67_009951 [Dinochytrium kinnereticum]